MSVMISEPLLPVNVARLKSEYGIDARGATWHRTWHGCGAMLCADGCPADDLTRIDVVETRGGRFFSWLVDDEAQAFPLPPKLSRRYHTRPKRKAAP